MQRALARQAAIEKNLSKYLHLACGHLQTYETFEVYRFAAKSGLTYCENCEATVKIVRPPKPKPLPEVPMFLWHSQLARDAPRNAAQLESYGKTAHWPESNKLELSRLMSVKAYSQQDRIMQTGYWPDKSQCQSKAH